MNASPAPGAARAGRGGQMSAEPAIRVSALGFSYGEREALCAVEFAIARGGEVFGLLGPNGGGKTPCSAASTLSRRRPERAILATSCPGAAQLRERSAWSSSAASTGS